MLLNQTLESIDWTVEILKSLIVSLPVLVVTIAIWQLNVYDRKRRDKINLASKYSALLYKFSLMFKETEKTEITFQMANSDKVNQKDNLKEIRLNINNLNRQRLDVKTELTETFNRLASYMSSKKQQIYLEKYSSLDRLRIRKFEEEFKNIPTAQAIELGKSLRQQLEENYLKEGAGKISKDIMQFIKMELQPKFFKKTS